MCRMNKLEAHLCSLRELVRPLVNILRAALPLTDHTCPTVKCRRVLIAPFNRAVEIFILLLPCVQVCAQFAHAEFKEQTVTS